MAKIDKEAFAAAVIHDLRAPLNACLMSLSLLELKASQPAEVLRSAEVVRRNLDRQSKLIDELADVMQIIGPGLALIKEPADIAEMIDQAAGTQAATAGGDQAATAPEPHVPVRWTGARPSARLEADVERLTRTFGILFDLVSATALPGDTISVRAAAGERLRIDGRLERSGAHADGESPARRKRSTMRFAIAEQVVEAHGGQLSVDDGGTWFRVELPAS